MNWYQDCFKPLYSVSANDSIFMHLTDHQYVIKFAQVVKLFCNLCLTSQASSQITEAFLYLYSVQGMDNFANQTLQHTFVHPPVMLYILQYEIVTCAFSDTR